MTGARSWTLRGPGGVPLLRLIFDAGLPQTRQVVVFHEGVLRNEDAVRFWNETHRLMMEQGPMASMPLEAPRKPADGP